MSSRVLYDLYDNNEYVGTFKTEDIVKTTGLTRKQIYKNASVCSQSNNRYQITRSEEQLAKSDNDAMREWDRVRRCILNGIRP